MTSRTTAPGARWLGCLLTGGGLLCVIVGCVGQRRTPVKGDVGEGGRFDRGMEREASVDGLKLDGGVDGGDAGDGGGCVREDGPIIDSIYSSDRAVKVDHAAGDLGIDGDYTAAKDFGGEADISRIDLGDGPAREGGGDDGGASCPSEMVLAELSCVDIYEASRFDATESSAGVSTVAAARPGVIPWFPVTLAQARAACATMGKRLCRADEWSNACQGPTVSVYAYGSSYDPLTCNGIDTFCNCNAPACSALTSCPYPHCYNQTSISESGGPCGAGFRVMPTGSFPACGNAQGVMDLNGNVWEIVDSHDGLEHFRGGAFNCGDSELLHRCDYDATWNPSARGFRCCKDQLQF